MPAKFAVGERLREARKSSQPQRQAVAQVLAASAPPDSLAEPQPSAQPIGRRQYGWMSVAHQPGEPVSRTNHFTRVADSRVERGPTETNRNGI